MAKNNEAEELSLAGKIAVWMLAIVFIAGYWYYDSRRSSKGHAAQASSKKPSAEVIINIAKYTIQKSLKNPDSASYENFSVVESKPYRISVTGKEEPGVLWLVHGVVAAENSFGGRLKNGYCITFSTDLNMEKYTERYTGECQRSIDQNELESAKAFTAWDHYQ